MSDLKTWTYDRLQDELEICDANRSAILNEIARRDHDDDEVSDDDGLTDAEHDEQVCGHLPEHELVDDLYDEHDGQPDEAQEWHDFDPDC